MNNYERVQFSHVFQIHNLNIDIATMAISTLQVILAHLMSCDESS